MLCGLWGLRVSVGFESELLRWEAQDLEALENSWHQGTLIDKSPPKGFYDNTKTKTTQRSASPDSPMPILQQNRNTMLHTSRQAAQSHTNPTDTLKPTTGHSTALQRNEIQPHWLEYWYKSPKPGNHHRVLEQPHPQGADTTTKNYHLGKCHLFKKSLCSFPLHTSTCMFAFCDAVDFPFLKIIKIFLLLLFSSFLFCLTVFLIVLFLLYLFFNMHI